MHDAGSTIQQALGGGDGGPRARLRSLGTRVWGPGGSRARSSVRGHSKNEPRGRALTVCSYCTSTHSLVLTVSSWSTGKHVPRLHSRPDTRSQPTEEGDVNVHRYTMSKQSR